jgi:hypothetical protein
MAVIATLTGYGDTIEVDGTGGEIVLDTQRSYGITHPGMTTAETPTATDHVLVYGLIDMPTAATWQAEADKVVMWPGCFEEIAAGTPKIFIKSAGDSISVKFTPITK